MGQSAFAASGDAAESAYGSEVALRLADAPRWTDVLAREAREAGPPARASVHCLMPADELPAECGARPDWRAGFQSLRGLPAGEAVVAVQARVNKLPYVSDLANWGMADRWETPAEMFARGGDCEDYALTKYFALRDLGFSERAMRIAIVWDNDDREQHAVLFVEVDGQNWVLDNKFAVPMPASSLASRYRVIWSVNRDGARLSTAGAEGEGGPRMRVARGGRMLVFSTRPIRRDQAQPMSRIEIASAGQGGAHVSVDFARIGGEIPSVAAPIAAMVPAIPQLPEPVTPAPQIALARAGENVVRYTGK